MDSLVSLFSGTGTASTIVFLSLAGLLGILLGKVKLLNIKLGIAGVLFSGLLLGHLGATSNPETLHFAKEFGLILFVYTIGLEVGPRFMNSLKSQGLSLNMMASLIVFLNVGIAIAIKFIFKVPLVTIAGLLSGAVTNTPSLGAAEQVLRDQGGDLAQNAAQIGIGYALAYPFGILGIIFTMILIRVFFKIKIEKEAKEYTDDLNKNRVKLESVSIKVTNPNLVGVKIKELKNTIKEEFVISRLVRNQQISIPDEDLTIENGDILTGVSTEKYFSELKLKIGDVTIVKKPEIIGAVAMKHILVTNKRLVGKTIEQIGIYRRYPANITRIFRAGSDIMANPDSTIEFGDTVRVVGKKDILEEVANELGDSMKELSHPNVLPIFLGIFLGIVIGSIPIYIPGLPAAAKLGLAGGPLLVAIFLGHKGRIGKLDFYMTPGANLMLREIGIVLFLACVGLSSGENFVSSLMNGGLAWMGYGALITFIPLIIVGFIARLRKYNYLTISGFLAGSMTDPPALEFANSIAPVQAQATAYATVYPLVMFLRVLTAQIMILLFV
ncbi:MAG: putative transporter [Salinivirgaceae bacterium]|nr:putative transporter [Salinivirgaceae bacterium]